MARGILPQACSGNRQAQRFLVNLPAVLSRWCKGSAGDVDRAVDIFAMLHGDFGATVTQSVIPWLARALDEAPRHQRTALRVFGAIQAETLGAQLPELQSIVWRLFEQHLQDGSANVTASCRAAFRLGEATPWSILQHVARFEPRLLAKMPAAAVAAALSKAVGDAGFEPRGERSDAAQAAEALLSGALAILENRLCDPCERCHWASVVGCLGRCPVDGGVTRVLRTVSLIAEEILEPASCELLLQLRMPEAEPGLLEKIADLGWGAVSVLVRQRASVVRLLQRDPRAAHHCAARVLRQRMALSEWCSLFAEAGIGRTVELEAGLTELRRSVADETIVFAIQEWLGSDDPGWWECSIATRLGPEQARVGLGCY
mmetsp:Transcript_52684/g.120176  ORF Transcript_52684/g.120176 Transcript_52684/m.120176 type:complete len:373 (+) Transcript_52684:92-1210(+)